VTEIATRDTNTPVPANQPLGSSLETWAREAAAISGIAQAIAGTTLAGAYRGKRDEIVAVVLAGHELGLQPMTSLKSIDVIQGQPALRAHAMRGIVQAQGHEVEVVESTPTYCKMRGRRKGSEAWQEVEWDIDRARLLGLMGKDQWKKQPKTMLIARATGEICRLIASDALHGMPYVAEELEGTVHAELVPQAAPLSIAAVTGPSMPVAPAPVDTDYTVTREDETEWEEVDGSTDWPATAQPGGEA